jgi:hypothetical protein
MDIADVFREQEEEEEEGEEEVSLIREELYAIGFHFFSRQFFFFFSLSLSLYI